MFIDQKIVPQAVAGDPSRSHRFRNRPASQVALTLMAGLAVALILFFLVLPTLIIIPMSLSTTAYLQFPPQGITWKWYAAYFGDPDWMAATWFSLRIAIATSIAATIVGTMTALAIVRGDIPFKGALHALSLGPMIVPDIVLGVALYLVFSPLHLTGTLTGFLIGHTVLAVPFVVITVTAALQRLDPALELAALNCGATRTQTFFHVTLPNIAPGVASGAVFAFLASFDEATVAFFISDVGGKTIGRKMFEDIDFNLTPVIAAASTVVVVASLFLIGSVQILSNILHSSRRTKRVLSRRKNFACSLAGIVVAGTACLMYSPAKAEDGVVIASTGGAYDRALKEAWFDPFSKATGIPVTIVSATNSEMRAKVVAMVKSGNVSWDLYLEGEIQAASDTHRQVTEDLSAFCQRFSTQADLAKNACEAGGALLQSTATLLAYRKDGKQEAIPETWADMWNIEKFPGGRALPNFDDPWRVLAAALLADGVEKNKLFPLDVDRAFRKLDEIRDHVTLWWKTGDQSVQGFRNGEYDLGQIWLTRAKAMKNEGLPIGWSYKASFLVGDRIALIKGAPNRNNALKLIAFWLDNPSVQAQACNVLSCTPPSTEAISLMSEEVRKSIPTTAEIKDNVIIPDAAWINANAPMLLQRWNNWVR